MIHRAGRVLVGAATRVAKMGAGWSCPPRGPRHAM